MEFKLNKLIRIIDTATVKDFGDGIEKISADFIKNSIPNYEEFWKHIVFPFRGTEKELDPLLLSKDLPRDHETVCIYNYSLFRSLKRGFDIFTNIDQVHKLSGETYSESFNDCILYLSIAYNQIKLFGVSILMTFLDKNQSEEIDVVRLSELELRDDIKPLLIKCSKYYGSDLVKNIRESGESLNRVRNFVVHGPKFPGCENLIPRPDFIQDLIQWSDFHDYICADPDDTEHKLIDRFHFLKDVVRKVIESSNNFWQVALEKITDCNPTFDSRYINPCLIESEKPDFCFSALQSSFDSYYKSTSTSSRTQISQDESGSISGDTRTRR